MNQALLVFPHQLFEDHPLLECEGEFFLVEEYLFFRQFAFHKQKIAFHRATMRFFASVLKEKGRKVHYIASEDKRSDLRELLPWLAGEGVDKVWLVDPTDDWLERRLEVGCREGGMEWELLESPLFLNERTENDGFFRPDGKKFFQTTFYKDERKKRDLLLDGDGEPEGGKWSFDQENRKKYPKKKTPPQVHFPERTEWYDEARTYVEEHFADCPGSLGESPLYPVTYEQSRQWLDQFLEKRFEEFGDYEDAIVSGESILNHSVLTPMLNTGLLTPREILDAAVQAGRERDIPLNSLEGFVRQVIGWREFIRGIYQAKGREERTRNFWGFDRKIPVSFYEGTTGIPPVDQTIRKVLETGYCHHIERLMVLGNFMLLCEFDPDEVYRWFMELFIDAYDWVMVPNVYGMSQFADGGLMATKPYISGSNYVLKMSDYGKGDWTDVWDGLFWSFLARHRDFFEGNPRLAMLLGNLDRMDEDKRSRLFGAAGGFLSHL